MQPLCYAAVAAIAGIIAAVDGPALPARAVAAALVVAAIAALGFVWLKGRWAAAVFGLLLCLVGGYGRARYAVAHPPGPSPLAAPLAQLQNGARQRVWVTGYLRDDPEATTGTEGASWRLDIAVQSISASLSSKTVYSAADGVRLYAYGAQSGLAAMRAGDGIAATSHLRAVSGYRDPGVEDVTVALRREDIAYTGSVPAGGWQPWPVVEGPRLAAVQARVWSWLTRRLDLVAPPASQPEWNGVLRGMLLGDIERIDPAIRTAFQIDGVYHLLVVAGLHIGVLAGFLLVLFRRLHLPRLPAEAVTLAVLGLYAWIIAGRTPTLRALLMLGLYFLARAWYRERQPLNAVGFAALGLLAWRPLDVGQPGFQMSLGAALLLAGVVVPALQLSGHPLRRATLRLDDAGFDEAFAPRWAQFRLDLRALATRLGRFSHPLGWRLLPWTVRATAGVVEIIFISAVLQVGFAAFNVIYFHRMNPWATAANAVLVPAAGLIIPAGWVAVAAGGNRFATRAAAWLLGHAGRVLLATAFSMSRWPGATFRVPSPPLWFLDVFGVTIAMWIAAWALWRSAAILVTSATAVVMTAILTWCPFPPRLPPGLAVTALDVGQGDALFVSFPDGRTLVVDGGPSSARWDSGEQVVDPFLWSMGLHRVDAVLLTHGHNDHLGGLAAVVRDFRPAEVWVTPTLPREWPMTAFLREVAVSGARLRRCGAGDVFRVGNARLEVLLPPRNYISGEIASNDDSMAVRVEYGGVSAMLTGDTEAGGEDWMLAHNEVASAALLKVGHHGSNTSTTAAFLQAVQPRAAVISVGRDNLYGHPSPDVVERLEATGVRVFRTDRDGAIQTRFQGHTVAVYLFPHWPDD